MILQCSDYTSQKKRLRLTDTVIKQTRGGADLKPEKQTPTFTL